MRFVEPRRNPHPRTNGYLVIESDDGALGDYTEWFPALKAVSHEYSQFHPFNLARACLNVNSGDLGNEGRMSPGQVQELYRYGWAIHSHGRHHVGIGLHPLTQAVSAGATRIHISNATYTDKGARYDFRIWDNENEEIIRIVDNATGYIDIDRELQHSYGTDAHVQITEEAAYELLQGCLDDLAAWKIAACHHAYTWHSGSNHAFSSEAVEWVGEIFVSGRGREGTINAPGAVSARRLYGFLDSISFEDIDTRIAALAGTNRVLIYYGHGAAVDKLKYIARKAIEAGVKIVTRSEACKVLFG